MEQELKPIIERALESAMKTGEFIIEQAPMLLQEFYQWQLMSNVFSAIISFIVFLVCVFLAYKFRELDAEISVIAVAVGWVVGLISSFVLVSSIYNLIFMAIAPNMYLIQYFIGIK